MLNPDKKETWRLLVTPPKHGAWNMAVDEAILEKVVQGESAPTFRLYSWEPACLSLGYAQSFQDVDIPRLQSFGWDLVRRPTGGRAVLHVDELTYSISAPAQNPHVSGTVIESYLHLAKALVRGLELLGIAAELSENANAGNLKQNNPVCFETPSTYEIAVGGRKLIGSAQARRIGGVLQHGSLPLNGDISRIVQVLVFPDEPSRNRASERLLQRAITLESALQHQITWQDVAEAMIQAFKDVLEIHFEPISLSNGELRRVDDLIRKKYDNQVWTEKKEN